jgi:transcriptional regulator with XRE-family HTH domain
MSHEVKQKIGRIIKDARLQRSIEPEDAARKFKLHTVAYHRIENGTHLPGKETFDRIIEAFPEICIHEFFNEYNKLVFELSARRAGIAAKGRAKTEEIKKQIHSKIPNCENNEVAVAVKIDLFKWMVTRLLKGQDRITFIEELRRQGVSDKTILDLVLHMFESNT